MFVRHYMVRSAVAISTVVETATLGEAVAKMVKHHMQQLLITKADGEYVGEISTFTLARLLLPEDLDRPQTAQEAEEEQRGRLQALTITSRHSQDDSVPNRDRTTRSRLS